MASFLYSVREGLSVLFSLAAKSMAYGKHSLESTDDFVPYYYYGAAGGGDDPEISDSDEEESEEESDSNGETAATRDLSD